MDETELESAVRLLRNLKRDLMRVRRFSPYTFSTYRQVCSSAEGDIEEWMIKHGYLKPSE
ncbi:hypothetical protein [Burkholderia gladioli]|uniref:hypothetical protein n=1 Tax=Burkholderia gladioli TaxID=28095 RepID=UPI000D00EB95|nr:hypothetical protein [Burkholderia gladioli]PRH37737.1 hypothetical protein C6V07_01490 [Burkholderia gladioli]